MGAVRGVAGYSEFSARLIPGNAGHGTLPRCATFTGTYSRLLGDLVSACYPSNRVWIAAHEQGIRLAEERKRGALFYTLDDMKLELTLRIVLERPPKGVDFGLQKGRGSAYETVQKQRSKESDLVFTFIVEAKAESKAALPSLHGPFVQGPPG